MDTTPDCVPKGKSWVGTLAPGRWSQYQRSAGWAFWTNSFTVQAALLGGHAEVVDHLLPAGENVNALVAPESLDALEAACFGADKLLVDKLLRAGPGDQKRRALHIVPRSRWPVVEAT